MCTIGDTVHLHSPRVDIDRREAVSTSAGVSQNDKVCYKIELILYILITSQCSGCVVSLLQSVAPSYLCLLLDWGHKIQYPGLSFFSLLLMFGPVI